MSHVKHCVGTERVPLNGRQKDTLKGENAILKGHGESLRTVFRPAPDQMFSEKDTLPTPDQMFSDLPQTYPTAILKGRTVFRPAPDHMFTFPFQTGHVHFGRCRNT